MIFDRRRPRGVAAAVLAVAAVCAGCKGHNTVGPTTYVTVTVPHPSPATAETSPAPTASGGAAESGAAVPASTTASPSPSTAAHAMTALPGRCDTLLPAPSIVDAVGRRIEGSTAFVVGTADSTEHKLGYLNCRYGVSPHIATPTVEIGVNLYRDAADAQARIAPTVDDFEANGATASQTTVGSVPATVLTGGSTTGYGPTIVLAAGQRTIVVTLRPGAFPATRTADDLTRLAALATEKTSSS